MADRDQHEQDAISQLHQIAPHVGKFNELLRVIGFQEIEAATKIRPCPSAEQLDPWRRKAPRFFESARFLRRALEGSAST